MTIFYGIIQAMDSLLVFAFFVHVGVELFSGQVHVHVSGVFSWQGPPLLSLFKMTYWVAMAMVCIHTSFLAAIISY